MIYFIGAGPGDIDLITVKASKILKTAKSIVYAGSLVNKEILSIAPRDCTTYDSAYLTLDEVIDIFEENEKNNIDTVRLHTGDPSIYGAVREQFDELRKRDIKFEVIPGVSSFLAAAASLKEEYTLPGVSQSVIITRMEGRTKVPEFQDIASFAKHKTTMVIFLSIHLMDKLINELLAHYPVETPVAVVYKASWEDELIIRGSLSDIAKKVESAGITKTALITVGEFLGDNYELSKLYDKNFSTEYRKAKNDEK